MKIIKRELLGFDNEVYIVCTFDDESVWKYFLSGPREGVWEKIEPTTTELEESFKNHT